MDECVGTCFKNIALGVASAMLPVLGDQVWGHWSTHRARRISCHPPLCLQQGQPPKQVSGASSVSLRNSLLTDNPDCGEPLPSTQDFHTCELIFFSFTVSRPFFVKLSKTLWRAVSQYIILLILFYAYECFSCIHICAVWVWHPRSLKVSGGCKSPCELKPTSTKATSVFTTESSLQPNR